MTAAPRTWVVDGTWPTGQLAADAPPAARHVAGAARLVVAFAPSPARQAALAVTAGVDPEELRDLVTGAAWPTVEVLARLEVAVGRTLW